MDKMIPLTTIEDLRAGDLILKRVSYETPEGKHISWLPQLVVKVRKNFVDVKDEWLNIQGSMRKATFKQHGSNYGKTCEWFVMKGED